MLLPCPLFCWWKSQSLPEPLPFQGPWAVAMDGLELQPRVLSDTPGTSHAVPSRLSCCSVQDIHQENQIFALLGCSLQPELLVGGKESGRCFHPGSESAVCVRERIPREEWAFVWMVVEKGFLSFLPKALRIFGEAFPGGASLRNHWALPPELHLVTHLKPDPANSPLGMQLCLHEDHPVVRLRSEIPSGN